MRWFEPIPEITESKLPKHWFLFAMMLIIPVNIIGWLFWAKIGGKSVAEGLQAGLYCSLFGLIVLFLISKVKFLGAREVLFGVKNLHITNTTPLVKIAYKDIQEFSFGQFEDSTRLFNQLTVSTKDGHHTSILIPEKISETKISEFLTTKINRA